MSCVKREPRLPVAPGCLRLAVNASGAAERRAQCFHTLLAAIVRAA